MNADQSAQISCTILIAPSWLHTYPYVSVPHYSNDLYLSIVLSMRLQPLLCKIMYKYIYIYTASSFSCIRGLLRLTPNKGEHSVAVFAAHMLRDWVWSWAPVHFFAILFLCFLQTLYRTISVSLLTEAILYSVQMVRWLSLVSPKLCQSACAGSIPVSYPLCRQAGAWIYGSKRTESEAEAQGQGLFTLL